MNDKRKVLLGLIAFQIILIVCLGMVNYQGGMNVVGVYGGEPIISASNPNQVADWVQFSSNGVAVFEVPNTGVLPIQYGGTGTKAAQIVSNNVVTYLQGYMANQGVTAEQFGAVADGRMTLITTMTTGSSNIVVSTGPFTTNDIGKWMVAYANLQGTNWLVGMITNVLDTNTVTLNVVATNSASNVIGRWGTDNTTNIQNAVNYCLSNSIHHLYFTNGVYFICGTPVYTGTNFVEHLPIYSIIQIATDPSWHNYTTVRGTFQFEIHGCTKALEATTGYWNYTIDGLTNQGTTFYCPVMGTNNGNDFVFSLSPTNGLFSWMEFAMDNCKFLEPWWHYTSWLDCTYDGAVNIQDCSFQSDSYGYAGRFNWQGNGCGNTNVWDIRLGTTSNNGFQRLARCEFNGGYNGVYANDHAYLEDCAFYRMMNAVCCGTSLEIVFKNTRFDVDRTNIWAGYNGACSLIKGDVNFSVDWWTNGMGALIWDTCNVGCNFGLDIFADLPAFINYCYFNQSGATNQNYYTFNQYSSIKISGSQDNWQTYGMKTSSNYFGYTFGNVHAPYGIQCPGQNGTAVNSLDYSSAGSFYFGGNNTGHESLFYNSQYYQWIWCFINSSDVLNFRNGANGNYTVTLTPYTGVIQATNFVTWQGAGAFTGNGSGLTNANGAALLDFTHALFAGAGIKTTNATSVAFSTGGITNTLSVNLQVFSFSGSSVIYSNPTTKMNASLGYVTNMCPVLQPGEMMYGTGCTEGTNRAF